jgi:hypothetical protein
MGSKQTSLAPIGGASYSPNIVEEKFSEVETVASRNRLQRILTTNVALGAGLRAKSSSQAPLFVAGAGREGKIATVNFGEFLFPDVG